MGTTIHRKDLNGNVSTKVIEGETEKDIFESIYKIYNSGRYTIQLLWLDNKQENEKFWSWTKSLSIGDYCRLNGKYD